MKERQQKGETTYGRETEERRIEGESGSVRGLRTILFYKLVI